MRGVGGVGGMRGGKLTRDSSGYDIDTLVHALGAADCLGAEEAQRVGVVHRLERDGLRARVVASM